MTHPLVLILAAVASTLILVSNAKSTDTYRHDSVLIGRALAGLHQSLNDNFRTADSTFAKLAEDFPLSPIGPMLSAGNVQAEMLDTESLEKQGRFETYLREAESRAMAIKHSNPDHPDAHFVLGVIAGYRAVYESKWGGRFAAFKQGLRAKSHFEDALEADSSLCDAYLGLGTYAYWKSAKTDWINWLPIVKDERQRGFAYLNRSMSCGSLTKETARASLASACLNEDDYEAAMAHADTLAAIFSGAKAPLWLKAKARLSLYEWDEALALFNEIERRIRASGSGNYYNLIECAYFRAQCRWGAGQYREALGECGKALTYPADEATKKRQKGRLDELRRMQRKLVKMVSP